MHFLKYLSFKYKITQHKPKESKKETILEFLGILIILICLSGFFYLVLNFLPDYVSLPDWHEAAAIVHALAVIQLLLSLFDFFVFCIKSVL